MCVTVVYAARMHRTQLNPLGIIVPVTDKADTRIVNVDKMRRSSDMLVKCLA